jgi:hypothetical protein
MANEGMTIFLFFIVAFSSFWLGVFYKALSSLPSGLKEFKKVEEVRGNIKIEGMITGQKIDSVILDAHFIPTDYYEWLYKKEAKKYRITTEDYKKGAFE